MMRTVSRLLAAGAALAASGCMTTSSIDLVMADPTFEAKQPETAAAPAAFRVGDVFRYRAGKTLVAETVEKVDSDGAWWRDSLGRRWIGAEGALIPARDVACDTDGQPQVTKASIETTGELFPLALGKTVAYRTTSYNWLRGDVTRNRSCTVEAYGTLKIEAGTFDAYRLRCVEDGILRFNYYAPAVGRVVLQTADTLLDSVKRELVGFERGTGEPLRAAAGDMKPAAGPAEGAIPSSEPPKAMADKQTMENKAPAAQMAAAGGRYGIQLAAYRSPARLKQAWSRIRPRGGLLLADTRPTVEKAEKGGSPLFRLVVGDFATKKEASAHCRALKRKGIDCWPRPRAAGAASPVAAAPAASKPIASAPVAAAPASGPRRIVWR